MNCADLEILICDYVDGTLSATERATVELHLNQCDACRALVEDSRAALSFMDRAADVEPPAALVNRILFEARKTPAFSVRRKGLMGWAGRLVEPVLQPKFAMGMAMTILSFSMLGRFAGLPNKQIRPADLEPARLWATLEDRAYRTWDRAKKYYESLRLVYEIRQTLTEWNEKDEAKPFGTPPDAPDIAPQSAPAEEGPIPVAPGGRSANEDEGGRVRR